MTAAGEACLAVAYSQVGVTEDPPNSNNVPYDDAWGFNSAWCATFVSWCCERAGYPLPPINGPAGFSYCPDGQIAAFSTGHAVTDPEPGDIIIFSWEPFYYGSDGIAYCSSGIYAGAAAGDHTALFARWLGGSYMLTVEGNTSQSSWDNGGAVMERNDRYTGQVCCFARHQAIAGGPSAEEDEMTEADFSRITQIVHEEVLKIWRAKEMENIDISRSHMGSHSAGLDLMRSDEYGNIVEAACRRAQS